MVRATLNATSRPSFSVLTWVRARARLRARLRARVRVRVRVRARVRARVRVKAGHSHRQGKGHG